MEEPVLGPILAEDETSKELTKRRSKYIFKTVTASKKDLLKKKVLLEEEDGWSIDRKNIKSVRMKKEKPLDEQLEDELWCIVAKMGFKELSSGRNFTIQTKKELKQRQIDVFAKDDETALVIECTHCKTPGAKPMAPLIEKILAMREGWDKSICKYYGSDPKIKMRAIIATRNVIWTKADKAKAREQQICILSDGEIDYYRGLTNHLQSAARYQLLAHVFSGVDIQGLSKTVPATQGTMGKVNFYNFLISPEDLLKISYVGHKASRNIDESLETYQRALIPKRLKKIAEYISGGGKFPTNIVVNIKTKGRSGLTFEPKDSIGESSFGTLHLPKQYASAWIIDGQHRLYGYAYRAAKQSFKNDKSALPVLAFENLPPSDEMQMFIDINCEQVKVQKSLLVELYSDLHWNSADVDERLLALLSRIVSRLNANKDSPINNRVIVTGKRKTPDRCLTQTSLSDGLKISRLLGGTKKKQYFPGPFAVSEPDNFDDSLDKAIELISGSLNLFAEGVPDNWALGDRPGGYLCTNNAIRALFLVMMSVCTHVRIHDHGGSDLSIWTAEEIMQEMKKYLAPVISFFKLATADEVSAFRRQGSSLAVVKRQSQGMCVFINKEFPDFNPEGLKEYIETRDQEGTDSATVLINNIQAKLFSHVVDELKKKYGEANDKWWTEGVPYPVRDSCGREWERRKRIKACESYLYLINYQDIALYNWELLGGKFSLGDNDIGNRKGCVKWIKELNDIRSITHHPEKGVLTTEQTEFVRNISEKVKAHFH